ncbi:undecaprenyl-diphosphatase [Dysgonomonas sp. PH5-45]|uniref:phosphatase PAP2 family protein n=1 Tax=unclassified Dysgonomonas TaxID=2630389 RepID=UPI002475B82D|nr:MULTISPECIES: phosphatase PAP2 family protein [unclassified Dysgonomonas]MDH6355555.1 undecaprenyl-diphosphatase [Dysgonomonas sp. PH5-45]MDH6388452.1 undecaprenyl-diphosphatase [Dysgonomonas sp. PH5-37]
MQISTEDLLPLERELFLWLNSAHNDFWDIFMTLYSGKLIWIPLSITLFFTLIYKVKWKEAVFTIIFITLLILLCDQISSGVIKPFFSRFRPTHHPDFKSFVTIVDGYRGGRYGFISAHATNGFGVATFLSLLFRNKALSVSLYAWALITCYSRIYLGVHFITDIIGGIILGIALAFGVYYLYLLSRQKILKIDKTDLKKPIYSKIRAYIIIYSLLTIVLTIISISLIAVSY